LCDIAQKISEKEEFQERKHLSARIQKKKEVFYLPPIDIFIVIRPSYFNECMNIWKASAYQQQRGQQ